MKRSIFIMAVFLASCSDEGDSTDLGCLTGLNSSGDRVLIKCVTKKQYAAGNNVNAGGIKQWDYYTAHKWEPCDNCK